DENTLRITAAVRAGSGWQELEQVWAEAARACEELQRTLVEVQAELEALPGAADAARDAAAELGGHADYWRDVSRRLDACVHQPGQGTVYWISGGGRFQSAWLNAAPLDVSTLLRDRLFATPESTILVSATLAIDGSFGY